MGVLRHQWDMSPRDMYPAWDDIKETDWERGWQYILLDRMDQSIGNLIEALRTRGTQ